MTDLPWPLPSDSDPPGGDGVPTLPALQAAFLAWETRRLLEAPAIAAARLHIRETMAARLASDAELWGPPGEPIWKEGV
jgi:hypothetical protein